MKYLLKNRIIATVFYISQKTEGGCILPGVLCWLSRLNTELF